MANIRYKPCAYRHVHLQNSRYYYKSQSKHNAFTLCAPTIHELRELLNNKCLKLVRRRQLPRAKAKATKVKAKATKVKAKATKDKAKAKAKVKNKVKAKA